MLNLTTTNYPFRDRMNSCLVRRATFTGPASYTTGGVEIDNTDDFGWSETHTLLGTITNGTNLYSLHLDRANQKVLVFQGDGTQVANGTDLSGFTGEILATGK